MAAVAWRSGVVPRRADARSLARRVAWTVFALAALSEIATGVLQQLGRGGAFGPPIEVAGGGAEFGAVMVLYTFVGAVIVTRVPTNLVGWLFLAVSLDSFHGILAAYGSLGGGIDALPGAAGAAWLGAVLETPGPAPTMLAFLVFPTGRLLSPRWRWLVAAILAWVAVMVAATALAPGAVEGHPWLENPTGVPAAGGRLARLLEVGGLFPAVALPLCAAALIIRFRRARAVERQQLKWLVLSVLLVTVGIAAMFLTTGVLGLSEASPAGQLVFYGVFLPAVASCPIAASIAVLRYRLYEIDRIISRTIVYTTVTAVLAAAYVGTVIGLQRVLPLGEGSDVAVALSTLLVAAAFGPVRRRVQQLVDRRFNRRHYDATRVVEGFRQRLQYEVHLDALVDDLQHAVTSTVQPRASGVWLTRTAEG